MFSLTLIAGRITLASSCSTNFCRTSLLLFDDPTVVEVVERAFPSFSLQFVVADFGWGTVITNDIQLPNGRHTFAQAVCMR